MKTLAAKPRLHSPIAIFWILCGVVILALVAFSLLRGNSPSSTLSSADHAQLQATGEKIISLDRLYTQIGKPTEAKPGDPDFVLSDKGAITWIHFLQANPDACNDTIRANGGTLTEGCNKRLPNGSYTYWMTLPEAEKRLADDVKEYNRQAVELGSDLPKMLPAQLDEKGNPSA